MKTLTKSRRQIRDMARAIYNAYVISVNRLDDKRVLNYIADQNVSISSIDLLEVGSGLGDFASNCRLLLGIHPYCVDINLALANIARTFEFPSAVATAKQLPFPDEFFDVAHCSHVIEHAGFPDVAAILDELLRVLKPGGLVILRAPGVLNHRFYDDLDHVRPYPPASIIGYFENMQQQRRSPFFAEAVSVWWSLRAFELDPTRYTSRVSHALNLLFKFLCTHFRFPKERPISYVLILRKQGRTNQ